MRSGFAILVLALSLAPAVRAQAPVPAVPMNKNVLADPCTADPKSSACKDQKDAREAFARGLKLKKSSRDDEAFAAFDQAARLAPKNVEYLTAREIVRQQLVFDRVRRGNDFLAADRRVEAAAAFQMALELDPENTFAREQLHEALSDQLPRHTQLRIEQAAEFHLQPRPGKQDFHYRGDARGLFQTIARAFGIAVVFDDSFVPRPLRFDMDGADFDTAMQVAARLSKSFYVPLSASQVLAAASTPENHRQFDRMVLRTFYLPESSSNQELNEMLNVLRSVFEIRFITQQPATATITARAPQDILDAATVFLENFSAGRPEVLLDMTVYEVNRDALRSLGLNLPLQFQAFNIPAAALAALQTPNVQDLINQLISSGGINQANTQAIAALLAQLQSQQTSIFSKPVATFGGGTTLFGIPFPTATANFSWRDSRISTLDHVSLRASENSPATLRIGSRFPTLNATFAPIFNTAQISQVIGSQSFAAPFPSFTYEDLGITVKATPAVQGGLVSLQLELEIRALSSQSFNGIPVIQNRSYKTGMAVQDGEPAVMAGMLSRLETRSFQGIPGLGQLPGLSYVFGSPATEQAMTEILVVVRPHILRAGPSAGPEIWLPGS
jgi:general secretion pathway protein D